MQMALTVFLTNFRRTEWGRRQASIGHAGLPGETAASAPDAAHPWPSLHTTFLCQEGLAAGGSVNKHVVEQQTGETSKNVHGPGKRNTKYRNILLKNYRRGKNALGKN